MKFFISIFLVLSLLGILGGIAWTDSNVVVPEADKLAGTHYFGRTRDSAVLIFDPLIETNVNHLVLVPYAYQEKHLNAELQVGRRRRHRVDSVYMQIGEEIAKAGLQVSIKPHIWMRTGLGKWRSDITFTSDSLATNWGEEYRSFILDYARISEELKAPMFCIGTELTTLTVGYPMYWKELIADIRKVYSGKLYYAANWYEELESITFWDDLDMIGVQAYFPLTKLHHPSVEELKKGWKPIKAKLRKLSKKYGKPILFSELGYRSTSCAAIEPWEWVPHDEDGRNKFKLSLDTQANCYEAAFSSFWKESWFAGILIWQWRGNHKNTGGATNLDFTPQNKPAQKTIQTWFGS
ncbi:MAG: hypothetical protein KTR24_03570 [Saprospiraceae bacterium]|nr:hypothetical protein [Saprospiraceae bacterium]